MCPGERQGPACSSCKHNTGGKCHAYRDGGSCYDIEKMAADKAFRNSRSKYDQAFLEDVSVAINNKFRGKCLSQAQCVQKEGLDHQWAHRPSPRLKKVVNDLATQLDIKIGNIVRYQDHAHRLNLGQVDWIDGELFHTLILHSGSRNGHTLNMRTDKFEVIGGERPS